MATDDPTWNDTEFEPDPDSVDGFMASEERVEEPVEEPVEERVEERVEEHVEQRVVQQVVTPRKKQRGALFWFGTLASLVLLIAVIGGGIYWLSLPSAEEEAFYAKEASLPSTVTDSAVTVPSTEDLAVLDTNIIHEPEALEALFGDSAVEETVPAKAAEKVAENVPAKAAEKAAEKVPAKAAEKVAANITSSTKSTTPTPTKSYTKSSSTPTKTPTKSSSSPTKTLTSSLFVVQVFSSPSRDDADEWLQSLRAKNVSDAYVTEQKIKGESWYRVRFGQFSSREDAEAEALRLGFRQPWVARIR